MPTIDLYTDGGARGNPGPAAVGVRIVSSRELDGEQCFGEVLGKTTNNVAEYSALIFGLKKIYEQHGAEVCSKTQLRVFSDSELMIRQLQGMYRVRHQDLQHLFSEAKSLLRYFSRVEFISIPRTKNTVADKIVNDMLDYGRISTS